VLRERARLRTLIADFLNTWAPLPAAQPPLDAAG
jgi:hypothetical protein